MKFNLSKEVTAGVVVALIAVIMYWLIFFLKGRDIFSRFSTYYAVFESVDGLTATGPVYLRGLKIGSIDQIVYNQKRDCFEVSLNIESKYPIPANSTAQSYSADLLGTKAIRIVMGNSPHFLAHKDTLASDAAVDLMEYLNRELPALKEQVSTLLLGLETTVDRVNTVLGGENQTHLQNSLAHLSATLSHFEALGAYLNTEVPQIQSFISNIHQLAEELGAGSSDISATLSNLRTFTDTLRQANTANLVQDLNRLVNRLQDPDGSIGRLMESDEMHQKITQLLERVDSLVGNISKNPKKYLKISVF